MMGAPLPDPDTLSFDDPALYAMLARGEEGCFTFPPPLGGFVRHPLNPRRSW